MDSVTQLAILTPVLGRPHRVQPLVENIRENTPGAPLILFLTDADDEPTLAEIDRLGEQRLNVNGGYAAKINTGVRATDTPLVFLGADDLRFHPDWFEKASGVLSDTVQVVGVNDMCSRRVRAGRHATHFLMSRGYALEPTIDGARGPLSEAYEHSYVDDELFATAQKRGVLAVASNAIVEHMHPDAGRGEWDATYQKGGQNIVLDRARFHARSQLWT
jgi:glycosyltransferase involved in cell wall biosynthesis